MESMELTNAAVREYLLFCEMQKRLDRKTIKAYRIDLRQFLKFSISTGRRFDREAVKSYTARLNGTYKPSTVRRKLASIRALTTWLLDEGKMAVNPFERLRIRLREEHRLPRTIPFRVVERMLAEAHKRLRLRPDDSSVPCETAVLEALFATGMRVSELCGLNARDLDLKDGIIRIFGKGKKERILSVTNAEVLSILRRYAKGIEAKPGEPFFQNRRGHRLSEASVRRMVRKYGELAGEATRITPHMFRHTVATLLLEGDVDIRCIQQLLGHSSILTTQIYTHVADAKQREILQMKHPRNQLSFREA